MCMKNYRKRIPVFILYASPEAESWFLADWKNGFEYLYCSSGIVTDVEYHAKSFFSHQLKHYIDHYVLKEYSQNMEEYGWFDGKYMKLKRSGYRCCSDRSKGIHQWISKGKQTVHKADCGIQRPVLFKKLHGDRMLRNIQPDAVAARCRKFFGNTYKEILHETWQKEGNFC